MDLEQGSTQKVDMEETNAQQEAEFRQRIDSAPTQEVADEVRYERYKYECEQEERTPMSREKWQETTARLRANQARGQANEDAALNSFGMQNNNYAQTPDGQSRNPITYKSEEGIVTRPDAVTESKWIDVKSVDEGTVYYTEQLQAQKEGALSGYPDGKQRDLAVVISNDNPNNVRPSEPLANNATVFHRNSQTGKWSIWDARANQGQGGWTPIQDQLAASNLGSEIPQQ